MCPTKVLLILLVAGAAIALALALPGGSSSGDEPAEGDNSGLIAAPVPAPQPSIRVTARGRDIKSFGKGQGPVENPAWTHDADTQMEMVPPGLITDFDNYPGKVGLRLNDVGRNRSVAMDPSAVGDEGLLKRIHVDRPEVGNGQGHGGRIYVIGIYDGLLTDAAITGQAMKCKQCGNVTVCGVNPACVD